MPARLAHRLVLPVLVLGLMVPGTSVMAETPPAASAGTPELYRQMVACKDIAAAAERLACYDRQVAAFDAATKTREIVIADREEVQRARRGLFGFAAPVGRLLGFGGDGGSEAASGPDREEIDKITTKVARVGRASGGGWKLTFEEAGTWEQIDTRSWVMAPRAGQSAEIERGALGSFFVSVDGQRGIKMRRVE